MVSPKAEGAVIPSANQLVELRHRARHLTFFPRQQAMAVGGGAYRSRFRGRGMDFDEVRPYQPGDDIRTIDWRVTARTTRTHTKVFREERERPVLIVIDLRSSMFFGSRKLKALLACEIAATLAWAGLQAKDRVGGMIFGPDQQRDIRSGRSHHNVLRFIHALCETCESLLHQRSDSIALTGICEDMRRVATPGASIVLISDFLDLDHQGEKQLFQLARHCDLSLMAIHDPLEAELPPPGYYPVTDGRKRALLDTRDVAARSRFQQQWQKHNQLLETVSRRLKAGLLRFSTADDPMPALRAHYGARRGKSAGRRSR